MTVARQFRAVVSMVIVAVVLAGFMFVPSTSAASTSLFPHCTKKGTVKVNGDSGRWPYYQTLSEGSRGKCVKDVQRVLNNACRRKLAVDGIFGPKTRANVVAVQKTMRRVGQLINGKRFMVDGIVGPQTWGVMGDYYNFSVPYQRIGSGHPEFGC